MFWNRRLNRPFENPDIKPASIDSAITLTAKQEAFDVGYAAGREDGHTEGYEAGRKAGLDEYERMIEHMEERVDTYLGDTHATLWGRAFNILDPEDRPAAVEYICRTLRGVLNVGR